MNRLEFEKTTLDLHMQLREFILAKGTEMGISFTKDDTKDDSKKLKEFLEITLSASGNLFVHHAVYLALMLDEKDRDPFFSSLFETMEYMTKKNLKDELDKKDEPLKSR